MKGKSHLILFAVIAMFLLSGCVNRAGVYSNLDEDCMVINWLWTGLILASIGVMSNPLLLSILRVLTNDTSEDEEKIESKTYYYVYFCFTLMFTLYFGRNLFLLNVIGAHYPLIIGLILGILIVKWGYQKHLLVIDAIVFFGSIVTLIVGIICIIWGFNDTEYIVEYSTMYYWVWIAILVFIVGASILYVKLSKSSND